MYAWGIGYTFLRLPIGFGGGPTPWLWMDIGFIYVFEFTDLLRC